jgi:hypothetical protein
MYTSKPSQVKGRQHQCLQMLFQHLVESSRSSRDLFLAGTPAATAMPRSQGRTWTYCKNHTFAGDILVESRRYKVIGTCRNNWRNHRNIHLHHSTSCSRQKTSPRSTTSGVFFKKWAPRGGFNAMHHGVSLVIYAFIEIFACTVLQCNAMERNGMQCNAMQCNAIVL